MKHWYALNAKPHKERQVWASLHDRKIEAYLPLARVHPVNPRAARERPYFPGYLFVSVDLQAVGLSVVQWTPGLRGIVQFGSEPAVVPDNLVFELKRRIGEIRAAGGLVFDGLERGDPVRIVSGPFAGYEAVFDSRLSGSERVRVLVELIRQSQRPSDVRRRIPVELNAGSIERVRR